MSTPRIDGVIEQFQRARAFLDEAQESTDPVFRFRHLVAAIYFATSMAVLLLECGAKKDITQSKNKASVTMHKKLPRYELLMKLRANDYHRWGLAQRKGLFLAGGITLSAGGPDGNKITFEGGHTPLQTDGDKVFDEISNDWISIEDALSEYLEAAPDVLREFDIDVEARIER